MLWGLICFVHPSQPLEEENYIEIWGAPGIKLPTVWIICPSTVSQRIIYYIVIIPYNLLHLICVYSI